MARFGSGLAHALTQGLSGYQEGSDERMKQLIALAARQQAEARAKQQDEIARIGAITGAVNAGFDVSPMVVPDTASRRVTQGQNPTSPEAGPANPAPADASDDGTVLGAINGMAIKVPAGGPQSKAVREAAMRTKERLSRLTTLNEQVAPQHRKSPAQLQAIAQDDALFNQYVSRAAGVTPDPLEQHKAMRDYDVAHPTRNTSATEPSWQVVTTADGSMVQVNPKTGETRPIGLKARPTQASAGSPGAPTVAMRNKAAEAAQTISTVDEALDRLAKHPQAVGLSHVRGISDQLDQWLDEDGVAARAALNSVSSQLLHALSGAAVSPSEYQRLKQYVPTTRDRYEAAKIKLDRLRNELQRLHDGYSGGGGQPSTPRPSGDTTPSAPLHPDVRSLKAKYGLE